MQTFMSHQHFNSCVYNDRLLQYILPGLLNIDTQTTGVPFLAETILCHHTLSRDRIELAFRFDRVYNKLSETAQLQVNAVIVKKKKKNR